MRVLWFCNIMLPQIAQHLSIAEDCSGGWLTGLSDSLLKNPDIELSVAFPITSTDIMISGECEPEAEIKNALKYFGFPERNSDKKKYSTITESYAKTIITDVKPDVVHIFGTEFPHTLAVVNACDKLGFISRTLISIQGMVSVYAKHYYACLPESIVKGYTIRDFIKRDNIQQGRHRFEKRGKYETKALKKVAHISGRTDWDRACTSQINPNAQYHFCNETLRGEFYKHNWDIKKCTKHSIFVSQAYYPIKGLHFMLEALPEVLKKCPDTHLYVAGDDLTKSDGTKKQRIRLSYYGVYLNKLIRQHNLKEHITFTGILDEKQMCSRFLKSHVFASPSSIENSPNSLGEAMLLGVPSVASDVGGVKNLMVHNEEGYIYQYDAPYMLAHYICKLFEDDGPAMEFSNNAKAHAAKTHNREENVKRLLQIYSTIVK